MTDTPTPDAVRADILAFIRDELLPADVAVGPEDDLLSGELLDSLAILRLATFIDETWSIGMKPTDFRIENFQSAAVLTDFVMRSLAPGANA